MQIKNNCKNMETVASMFFVWVVHWVGQSGQCVNPPVFKHSAPSPRRRDGRRPSPARGEPLMVYQLRNAVSTEIRIPFYFSKLC